MSEKNPYELRLELLHMAQSILQSNAEMKRDLLHLVHSHEVEEIIAPTEATEIKVEDILDYARKLNEFISNG
jgi:hypothetical protein